MKALEYCSSGTRQLIIHEAGKGNAATRVLYRKGMASEHFE